MTQFTYVRLPDHKAKVTCVCGWELEPGPISPFDPQEALVAAHGEHPRCVLTAVACVKCGATSGGDSRDEQDDLHEQKPRDADEARLNRRAADELDEAARRNREASPPSSNVTAASLVRQLDRPALIVAVWAAEFARALNGVQHDNPSIQRCVVERAAERADCAVTALRLLFEDEPAK